MHKTKVNIWQYQIATVIIKKFWKKCVRNSEEIPSDKEVTCKNLNKIYTNKLEFYSNVKKYSIHRKIMRSTG